LRRWTDKLIEREKAVRKFQRESEERAGALQRQTEQRESQKESQKETERRKSQAKRGRKRPNPMRRVTIVGVGYSN